MEESNNNYFVEHVFRHEYGKIVSYLTHKFGPSNLEKIEDAVQESLIKAMQVWGYKKPPQNPTAWLLRVASNHLIDNIRRGKKMTLAEDNLDFNNEKSMPEEVKLDHQVNDSQLKMIFACCHPSISKEYQIILSLKLIGGFGNKEIARALLKKEEAVAKSFTRAKNRLKDHVQTLEIPVELGLKSRLNIVLRIIYLLFSEGYSTTSGENLIKKDICMEAIRLALLLSNNKYCDRPEVHALIALMCFHVSRFDARIDGYGEMVDLEHQNRNLYHRDLIQEGIRHLESASVPTAPSDYHLQATISYYHCTAPSFEETDWKHILKLYDLHLQRQYSPIVELNRIVPLYKYSGAEKALIALRNFEKSPHYIGNALFYAIKADILRDLKKVEDSKEAFNKAISLTHNELEKKHLGKKLRILESK